MKAFQYGFNIRFVARVLHASRDYGDAVVGGHLRELRIQVRLISVWFDDGAFGVVGDDNLGDSSQELERADVRVDPARKTHRKHALGVCETRDPECRDEDVDRSFRAGCRPQKPRPTQNGWI